MREDLRMFRVKRRLSQDKMAAMLGYCRNQYAKIENGAQGVTLKFLEALCDAFGMTLAEAKELTKRDQKQAENDRAAR